MPGFDLLSTQPEDRFNFLYFGKIYLSIKKKYQNKHKMFKYIQKLLINVTGAGKGTT